MPATIPAINLRTVPPAQSITRNGATWLTFIGSYVLRSQQAGENRAAPPFALALGRAIEVALIQLRTHWFAGERSNHGGVGRSGRRLLSLAVSAKLRQKDLARRIFCQMRRPI